MPARRIRVDPASAMRDGFEAVRREAGVPAEFPAQVEAEAESAARRPPERDRIDVPFVTIDPPGSRDLDQALHIEPRGDGHRVRYAIADPRVFIEPGGPLDRDTHERAVTVYAPDENVPLHPPVLSEGAASLLPGEWRPAALWTLDLDATGEVTSAEVARTEVRSVAQHTYEDVPDELARVLAEVGERRLEIERARGGVTLAVPEQEVVREGDAWTTRYRVPLPAEQYNAQISLLTGMSAAKLMLEAGYGVLRTQPHPAERAVKRLHRQAHALGVDWPADVSYADFTRGLDPAVPVNAALLDAAAELSRGAGYTAFDGAPPAEPEHFAIAAAYAHATAPLRRVQDRYVTECCLAACAGTEPPDWVRASLPELPKAMEVGSRRAHAVERGIVDLVEAVLLSGREGERFEAVVIDDQLVQLRDPPVRAKLEASCPPPGSEVTVRLERADPATRTVVFEQA
ncbi:MAG: RNB domain-containing ribonuclease [Gaiellaceae bacterium]